MREFGDQAKYPRPRAESPEMVSMTNPVQVSKPGSMKEISHGLSALALYCLYTEEPGIDLPESHAGPQSGFSILARESLPPSHSQSATHVGVFVGPQGLPSRIGSKEWWPWMKAFDTSAY